MAQKRKRYDKQFKIAAARVVLGGEMRAYPTRKKRRPHDIRAPPLSLRIAFRRAGRADAIRSLGTAWKAIEPVDPRCPHAANPCRAQRNRPPLYRPLFAIASSISASSFFACSGDEIAPTMGSPTILPLLSTTQVVGYEYSLEVNSPASLSEPNQTFL